MPPRIIEFRGCVVRTGGGLFKIFFDVACSTVQHKLFVIFENKSLYFASTNAAVSNFPV